MKKSRNEERTSLYVRLSDTSYQFVHDYRGQIMKDVGADLSLNQAFEAILQRARNAGWVAEPK